MRQTLGAPASWELNPGVKNGSINNGNNYVMALSTVLATAIATAVTKVVATSWSCSVWGVLV